MNESKVKISLSRKPELAVFVEIDAAGRAVVEGRMFQSLVKLNDRELSVIEAVCAIPHRLLAWLGRFLGRVNKNAKTDLAQRITPTLMIPVMHGLFFFLEIVVLSGQIRIERMQARQRLREANDLYVQRRNLFTDSVIRF